MNTLKLLRYPILILTVVVGANTFAGQFKIRHPYDQGFSNNVDSQVVESISLHNGKLELFSKGDGDACRIDETVARAAGVSLGELVSIIRNTSETVTCYTSRSKSSLTYGIIKSYLAEKISIGSVVTGHL
jgi:hypothetical protein